MFEVRESQPGKVALSSSTRVKTVDLGIDNNSLARDQHAGMLLISKGLASDDAIDRAIDRIVDELEGVRIKAKQLLASLKAP